MGDWCQSHPRYSAKRRPGSTCGRCWQLFFRKNPEEKTDVRESYDELAKMKENFA